MNSNLMQCGELTVMVIDLANAEALEGIDHGITTAPDRVTFFSDEWENRRSPCEAFVRARAGLFDRRVGARSCAARDAPRAEAAAFLKQYHLQGASRLSMVAFGLYENDDLLGVMSLGHHHRQIEHNWVVLDRLCFAPGVQVVGGTSRLFAQACTWARDQQYDAVISFSDNRLTPGAVYERLGFEKRQVYRPDYFYVRDGRRISKQSQRKSHTACPEGMTEWAWASARGLRRVYDAGKVCWIYHVNPDAKETERLHMSEVIAKRHAEGVFKNAHMRGYFQSAKNAGDVYFGSSYELRCMFELEADAAVRSFRRCEAFKGSRGWRNPDLRVAFVDGHEEIWEVKPAQMIEKPEVKLQIVDSFVYASGLGLSMRVWTERDSALGTCNAIIKWAHAYLADQQGDPHYSERKKAQRKAIAARHYVKEQAASVTVHCDYCKKDHVVLPRTYARNIARNGIYTCEAMAGHKGGSKPKLSLRKENPHAADGKKECCRCHQVQPFEAFDIRAKSRDGYAHACKACCSIANAARYLTRKAHTCAC